MDSLPRSGRLRFIYFPLLFALILALGACSSNEWQSNQAKLISLDADQLNEVVKQKHKDDKALLINVWATWCGPCVEEFPIIVELAEKYESKLDVMFISADFPQDSSRAVAFLQKQGVDWDTYLRSGSESEFIDALHPSWSGALPFTVIYNEQGEEITHWENKADSLIFDSYINQAIE